MILACVSRVCVRDNNMSDVLRLHVSPDERAKFGATFTKLDGGTGRVSLRVVKALWGKTPLQQP